MHVLFVSLSTTAHGSSAGAGVLEGGWGLIVVIGAGVGFTVVGVIGAKVDVEVVEGDGGSLVVVVGAWVVDGSLVEVDTWVDDVGLAVLEVLLSVIPGITGEGTGFSVSSLGTLSLSWTTFAENWEIIFNCCQFCYN